MRTKLISDNTEDFYRISMMYYMLGEEEDSLKCVCVLTIIRSIMEYCHVMQANQRMLETGPRPQAVLPTL